MKNTTIHDLPKVDRPREKLIKYGPDKLSNEELLAIILRTGRKGSNVLEISKNFFKKYADSEILNLNYNDLTRIKGLGVVKACEIISVIELGKRLFKNKKNVILFSPAEVWEEMKEVRESMKEHFYVIYLDSRHQKINKDLISVGTLNASLVHPREVFEPAIRNFAAGIILVHNHPSNNAEPSEADITITKRLIEVAKILDINIIDHVIVTKESWFSFQEREIL